MSRYHNYLLLANGCLMKEDYLGALGFFQKAVEFATDPKEKIDALYEVADLQLILEHYGDAQKIYQKILSIHSKEPGAHYGLSLTNEFLGGPIEKSMEHYTKAIALDPLYDRAYYYLGHLYDKVGDLEKAKECFRQCLAIDPQDYVTYNDLGAIYESQDELDMAEELVQQALILCPTYGRALFNLGVISRRKGQWQRAMDYYEKAVGKFYSPDLFLNMSALYLERGEYQKALDILNQGLERFEDSENLYYNKACCLNILGERKEALEALQMAVILEPEAKDWAAMDGDVKDLIEEMLW